MRKRWLPLLLALLCASPASAQVYPVCGTGVATGCTISIQVGTSSTPLFNKLPARQYLLIENQAYLGTTVVNVPICCAIGTSNQAVWTASQQCNGFIIYPLHSWEPPQMTAPQTAFRVPAGDVSCVSPLGTVGAVGEQE